MWTLFQITFELGNIPMDLIDYSKVSKVAIDGCGASLLNFSKKVQDESIKIIPAMDDTFLNIVSSGVDKSTSLKYVCSKLKVKMEDVVVFGDDTPDIEMMMVAGFSVAMGNSKEQVKEKADYVIGDCDSSAIYEFLSHRI